MPWITKEGRTVDEARDAAVAAAGKPADDLDIEVVDEGAKGLFGLGGDPAIVRVRPKDEATDFRSAFTDDITFTPGQEDQRGEERPARRDESDEELEEPSAESKLSLSEQQEAASELGAEIVKGILERMGLAGEVNTRVAGGTVYIEVFGEEMGILIGRGGSTLEALQEIVRAGIQRRLRTRQAVVVDVESYWERRRSAPREERPRREGGGGRRGGSGRRGGGQRRGDRREPDGNRKTEDEREPDGNR